jgi:phenylalanine ammonia-lyase
MMATKGSPQAGEECKSHLQATQQAWKTSRLANPVVLDGQTLSVADVIAVAKGFRVAVLSDAENVRKQVEDSVSWLKSYLDKGYFIYGVNTGFGGSADSRTTDVHGLQAALLQLTQSAVLISADKADHTSYRDIGPHAMPTAWVRATMLVRCNQLLRGHSGVRWQIIENILHLLNSNLTPIIPLRGSISASGDLMPLSYIAGVLEGNPDIYVRHDDFTESSSVMSGDQALKRAKLEPLILGPKEGLGLLNGAAAAVGVASMATYEINTLAVVSQLIIAMSCEAMSGSATNYHPFPAAVRPHGGQKEIARNILSFLTGSKMVETLETRDRNRAGLFQDRYPLRGASQWLGPYVEDCQLSLDQLMIELNSTQDNPLIDTKDNEVHFCCNFQAASVTTATEKGRLALQMMGKLLFTVCSELINPDLNKGLPANLAADDPDLSFTMKGVDINMAAYMSELAFLANPVSSHVQTAEMNNQGINSLALLSTRSTFQAAEVVGLMCAAHLYVVCQALDLRVLQNDFYSNVAKIIQTATAEAFVELDSGARTRYAARLTSAVTDSWAHSNKETLATRIRQLAGAVISACVQSTDVDYAKPNGETFSPDLALVKAFAARISNEASAQYEQLRSNAFQDQVDVSSRLGTGSRVLYDFVRKELSIPLHRGRIEHPTIVQDTITRERKTIGSWISRIYEALRSGQLERYLENHL